MTDDIFEVISFILVLQRRIERKDNSKQTFEVLLEECKHTFFTDDESELIYF